MPVSVTGRGQPAAPQKQDFRHADPASTAPRVLRTARDRMNPGFHLALTWWKPRFTSFTAGQSLMIKLNPSPPYPHTSREPRMAYCSQQR